MLVVVYTNNPDLLYSRRFPKWTVNDPVCLQFLCLRGFHSQHAAAGAFPSLNHEPVECVWCVWGPRAALYAQRRKCEEQEFCCCFRDICVPTGHSGGAETTQKITLINPHPAQTRPSTAANHCLPLAVVKETQQDVL